MGCEQSSEVSTPQDLTMQSTVPIQQSAPNLYIAGQHVTIKSKSSQCYLDGRIDPGSEVFLNPFRTDLP